MMDRRIRRAREEQVRLAALLRSGHPESEGIELAISDWFWEEMLVQRELERWHWATERLTLYDTLAVGIQAGEVGRGKAMGGTPAQRGPTVWQKPPFLVGYRARKEAASAGLAAGALMISPVLGRDLVDALAVLGLAGFELQAQLLADLSAQEASNAVRLPAGGFGEIGERSSFLSAQQFDNLSALAIAGLFHGHLLRFALCRSCHVILLDGSGPSAEADCPRFAPDIDHSGRNRMQGNSTVARRA